MHILFLNHNVAWSGGTFFRAYYMARTLTRRGHRCTVLAISPHNHLRPSATVRDGVRVVETPDMLTGIGRTGWDPWDTLWRTAWAWRHRGEFDLIYAFDSRPAVILPALFLKRAARQPLVYDWCDWWGRGGLASERGYGLVDRLMGPVETWFEERFRTAADVTTVISAPLRERAIGLGVPPETIFLIPQGCEPGKFQSVAVAAARARLGLPQEDFIAGYLGKLIASDQPFLVDVIRRVGDRIPRFKVLHMGAPTANLPQDLLDEGRFIQAGKVPEKDLGAYLSAGDVLILPLKNTLANNARWPSKINDYLVAGRPVVATRVSDIVPYFEKYGIGLLAEPIPEDFADKLVQLSQDSRRDEMGRRARELAETTLSWASLVTGFEHFYQQTVASHKLS